MLQIASGEAGLGSGITWRGDPPYVVVTPMDGFREIYERYYRDVHRFALFLTGDAARVFDGEIDLDR